MATLNETEMTTLTLSDFSFAERAIIDVWVWLWFIQRVWSTDKFVSLHWSKLRNFDLKSIITLLIFLMLPVQAIFDISWTYLKYNEGFIMISPTNEIIQKPSYFPNNNPLWTKEDLVIKEVTEYVLTFGFAFQIGTLALMQAFWSHLSSQMGGKPFMRSWEFRFYVSWVFASFIVFPTTRFFSSFNVILIETLTPLVYAIQLFIIFLLGIINGRRLNDLLKSIRQSTSPSGQETLRRIHYFIEMNKLLMLGTLLISIPFSIVNLDAIFIHRLVRTKFFLDLLLINANFGSLILWATMILIVYPRYYITGTISHTPLKSHHGFSDLSLEMGNVSKGELENKSQSSFVVTTTTTTMTTTSHPMKVKGHSIQKSINSLLEEQKQQINSFRHKTSMSISSTTTLASSHTGHTLNSPLISPSPSIPPPPTFPPPALYENDIR